VTALAALLGLLAVWLAIWSYVLYPAWIRRLAARRPERSATPPPARAPSVEVLVSAADEEEHIAARVRNLREQQLAGALGIAIGCDGCTDRTAERAREAASGDPRVRVLEFSPRRGKASVVNDLVATSTAELLVFTDANTSFEPGAVASLARALEAPGVGAACGRLVLEGRDGGPTAETLFWDRETRLKEAEGRLGVCLGANGAIYAARRAAVEPLPSHSALDDFVIPARIASSGSDVVFAGGAVARETLPENVGREVARRFRIGAGAGQILIGERWLWSRRRPLVALVYSSRKVARWLAPVAALGCAAAAAASVPLRPAGLAALTAAGLLLLSARLPLRPRGAIARLYYFGVINVALALGVLAGLAGYRRPAWRPAAKRP